MIDGNGPNRWFGPFLIGVVVVTSSCGPGSPDGNLVAPDSADSMSIESSVVPAETAPMTGEQEAVVDSVGAAVDLLLQEPAIESSYRAAGVDGGSLTGSVRIDNGNGDFALREELVPEINDDLLIISEKTLVGDTLYIRTFDGAIDAGTVAWNRTEPDSLRDELVGESYTASGAAGGSLNRFETLLAVVPWTLEAAAVTDIDGRTIESYLVRFDAADIWRYLGESGLERIGPVQPDGATFFEFWIDQRTGRFAALLAAGVQFHDGEPLPGAEIEIWYEPIDEAGIVAPVDVDG